MTAHVQFRSTTTNNAYTHTHTQTQTQEFEHNGYPGHPDVLKHHGGNCLQVFGKGGGIGERGVEGKGESVVMPIGYRPDPHYLLAIR